MNNLSMFPLFFMLLCALNAASQTNTPPRHAAVKPSEEASMTAGSGSVSKLQKESPFACDGDALSPTERTRHFDELGPTLRKLRTGVRELKNGFEFLFASDPKTYGLVTEWAGQEQRCCPFFDIDVHLAKEGGPLSMRLTGRKGTKEFIRGDFAKWFND